MIGERIKILRKNLRYSQEEFGKKISKSFSLISQMERGETPILEDTIHSIVLTFNVNKEWLLSGNGEIFAEKVQDYSNELEKLKSENSSLKNQVKQLMEMVSNLTTSVNMLSNKLGKLEGNEETYAVETGKIIPLATDSVTLVAKKAA